MRPIMWQPLLQPPRFPSACELPKVRGALGITTEEEPKKLISSASSTIRMVTLQQDNATEPQAEERCLNLPLPAGLPAGVFTVLAWS